MNRFIYIVLFSIFSLGTVSCDSPTASSTSQQPNVIIVITDDQGYGDLACLGNPMIKTPHIDKLWTQSVRLTNFHVDPTCAPTRSALMTGRYSGRNGVWHTIQGRSLLRKTEVTMADVFKENGYITAMYGKWHLGDNYPYRPQDRGFIKTLHHGGGGVTQTPDFFGNDYFDDSYYDQDGKTIAQKGYCTDVWFNNALEFIETNKDKPFFCYLSTNAPHGPLFVAEHYSDMYKDDPNVPSKEFYGMVTNIDDNMGILVKKLKEWDLEKNTILVFMTDNGTAGGLVGGKGFAAGMRERKGSNYEGGHRVPFFIRWPDGGLTAGKDVPQLTAHVDILPTLIDMCQLTTKKIKYDGTSIKSIIDGDGKNWSDRSLIVESQRINIPVKWRKCAVMTQQWRLTARDGKPKELYDILKDPGQQNNIIDKHPDVAARLSQDYEANWKSLEWSHKQTSKITVGNPQENPSFLTAHDWIGGTGTPWNQNSIKKGSAATGGWSITVEEAGDFEIALRRWPKETDQPINAGTFEFNSDTINGVSINATTAKIKIGKFEQEKNIPKDAKEMVFKCHLEKGDHFLETWFKGPQEKTDKKGKKKNKPNLRGAYYAYVKKM